MIEAEDPEILSFLDEIEDVADAESSNYLFYAF